MYTLLILAVAIAVIFLVIVWLLIRSGESLRRSAAQLDQDWSDIERFFKQRGDELPRLIRTCRSFMPPDRAALKAVSSARGSCLGANSVVEKKRASAQLAKAMQELFSDVGNYEELKNNSTYIQLRSRLLEVEERISERCDLYDDDAARFNARLTRFPGRLVKGKLKPRAR